MRFFRKVKCSICGKPFNATFDLQTMDKRTSEYKRAINNAKCGGYDHEIKDVFCKEERNG